MTNIERLIWERNEAAKEERELRARISNVCPPDRFVDNEVFFTYQGANYYYDRTSVAVRRYERTPGMYQWVPWAKEKEIILWLLSEAPEPARPTIPSPGTPRYGP